MGMAIRIIGFTSVHADVRVGDKLPPGGGKEMSFLTLHTPYLVELYPQPELLRDDIRDV